MSDLISRQAAIRWVKTECNPYGKPMDDVRWKYGIPPASNANFAWIQHINAAGRAAT